MSAVTVGPDGVARCPWGNSSAEYMAYHDEEWGREIRTDQGLYERLTLESFQSGLSWLTILRKRPSFRKAFSDFSLEAVASFDERDVERLLTDTSIVRNRMKIEAAIKNAQSALTLPEGLSSFVWSYEPKARVRIPQQPADVPPRTPESTALAKALKKNGFVFVGPTTVYALMQATGMVNDHLKGCVAR